MTKYIIKILTRGEIMENVKPFIEWVIIAFVAILVIPGGLAELCSRFLHFDAAGAFMLGIAFGAAFDIWVYRKYSKLSEENKKLKETLSYYRKD
jgi:hypothetical protein